MPGLPSTWAVSTLCSSRSSRMLEPVVVVAWVMLVGLLIAGPLALAGGTPAHVSGSDAALLFASGAGNVAA